MGPPLFLWKSASVITTAARQISGPNPPRFIHAYGRWSSFVVSIGPGQRIRLRFIPRRVVRDPHPCLRAARPKMNGGCKPRRIVQRARLDIAVRVGRAARNMIQPSPTVGAEPAFHRFHRTGPPEEHLRLPLRYTKMVSWYDRGHRKGCARLPLTLGAVARIHNGRWGRYFVSDRPALAPSALGKGHDRWPSRRCAWSVETSVSLQGSPNTRPSSVGGREWHRSMLLTKNGTQLQWLGPPFHL